MHAADSVGCRLAVDVTCLLRGRCVKMLLNGPAPFACCRGRMHVARVKPFLVAPPAAVSTEAVLRAAPRVPVGKLTLGSPALIVVVALSETSSGWCCSVGRVGWGYRDLYRRTRSSCPVGGVITWWKTLP